MSTTCMDERGFTLIEMLAAVAIVSATAGVLLHLASRAQLLAAAQPESADVHQRLRVAAGMIQRDLLRAGAAPLNANGVRRLASYAPPIVPARTGARKADPEITAFSDRLSILTVTDGAWEAMLASDMPAAAAPLQPALVAGCPTAGVCGFVVGTRALVVDAADVGAGYEAFSVTDISAGLDHGAPNPPFSRPYRTSSARIVPIVQHVYYHDRSTSRLMLYDGFQSDVPLIDNVVALRFGYFVDPDPSTVPAPPPGASNCVYAAGDPPLPLLRAYGGITPVPIAVEHLSDGPICGIAPYRFDGDLLRIRRVRVMLRVQAGPPQFRAAGAQFANAGSSPGGETAVSDYEMTFEVAPRNLTRTR